MFGPSVLEDRGHRLTDIAPPPQPGWAPRQVFMWPEAALHLQQGHLSAQMALPHV